MSTKRRSSSSSKNDENKPKLQKKRHRWERSPSRLSSLAHPKAIRATILQYLPHRFEVTEVRDDRFFGHHNILELDGAQFRTMAETEWLKVAKIPLPTLQPSTRRRLDLMFHVKRRIPNLREYSGHLWYGIFKEMGSLWSVGLRTLVTLNSFWGNQSETLSCFMKSELCPKPDCKLREVHVYTHCSSDEFLRRQYHEEVNQRVFQKVMCRSPFAMAKEKLGLVGDEWLKAKRWNIAWETFCDVFEQTCAEELYQIYLVCTIFFALLQASPSTLPVWYRHVIHFFTRWQALTWESPDPPAPEFPISSSFTLMEVEKQLKELISFSVPCTPGSVWEPRMGTLGRLGFSVRGADHNTDNDGSRRMSSHCLCVTARDLLNNVGESRYLCNMMATILIMIPVVILEVMASYLCSCSCLCSSSGRYT